MKSVVANVVRGGLIGTTELLPGVSGGTIALVTGVYDDLIGGAGHLTRGVARAVVDIPRGRGLDRARDHLARVRWVVLLPVAVGMVAAVFGLAHVISGLLETYPRQTSAVFFGLIAASVAIPVRMTRRRWGLGLWLGALAAAGLSFFLTGLPPADAGEPALWSVSLSAAFAVCALVLPGVSGSFVLLTIGMYQPTIRAVAERDVAYLGAFLLGAVVGLILFIQVLQWLLTRHRVPTLVAMAGLMIGSLRALWPWSDAEGTLQPPASDWPVMLVLALVAAAVVVGLVALEHRRTPRTGTPTDTTAPSAYEQA